MHDKLEISKLYLNEVVNSRTEKKIKLNLRIKLIIIQIWSCKLIHFSFFSVSYKTPKAKQDYKGL